MSSLIDPDLIAKTRRKSHKLGEGDRVAIQILATDDKAPVPVTILARVFKVARNTIYYKVLAIKSRDSYPTSDKVNQARETRDLILSMGLEAAKKKYITPSMIEGVTRELKLQVEKKEAFERARSERRRRRP